jgi:hypothetical protein
MKKLGMGVALLLSASLANAADLSRKDQCTAHYITMTGLMGILGDKDSPATPEDRENFNKVGNAFAERLLSVAGVEQYEDIPQPVTAMGIGALKAIADDPKTAMEALRVNIAACDKELGLVPIM